MTFHAVIIASASCLRKYATLHGASGKLAPDHTGIDAQFAYGIPGRDIRKHGGPTNFTLDVIQSPAITRTVGIPPLVKSHDTGIWNCTALWGRGTYNADNRGARVTPSWRSTDTDLPIRLHGRN